MAGSMSSAISKAQEITVECKDCGAEFTISGDEQKWYKEKGFKLPKRCPECRKKRKYNRRK